MTESAAGYERTVTVKKMRGVAIAPVKHKFTLQQDRGIVIDRPESAPAAASRNDADVRILRSNQAAKLAAGKRLNFARAAVIPSSGSFLDTPPNDA